MSKLIFISMQLLPRKYGASFCVPNIIIIIHRFINTFPRVTKMDSLYDVFSFIFSWWAKGLYIESTKVKGRTKST